jgi:hypothetical protein
MAYTILNTDGTTLLLLADGKIDQSTTSLTLIGKNYSGFGQYYNNNLITLLANSASTSGSPPRSPLTGQLWYDTTSRRLMVYDKSFKSVSGAIVSAIQPTDLSTGDLWWDTTNEQLKLWSGLSSRVIGPAFPKDVGATGWGLPTLRVLDTNDSAKNITVLRNYGNTIGYMSNDQFDINTGANYKYLVKNSNTSTVVGLTILGDVQVTGQITSNYLSLTVDTSYVSPKYYDLKNTGTIGYRSRQNAAIANVLNAMYPVNVKSATTMTNSFNAGVVEQGVPLHSRARVLCMASFVPTGVYGPNSVQGNTGTTQVRLFEARKETPTSGKWYAVSISGSNASGDDNVIAEFRADVP